MEAITNDLPNSEQIGRYLADSDCFDIALAVAEQWPHLEADAGYFVKSDGTPADHHWNRHPDGTIVDATASQFASADYIIAPDHELYQNYVSYQHQPERAQSLAHQVGHHRPAKDYVECCPDCALAVN